MGGVSRNLGRVGGPKGLTGRGCRQNYAGRGGEGSWQRSEVVWEGLRGSRKEKWRGSHHDGRSGLIGGRKALQIPLEQMRVVAPMPRRAGEVGGQEGQNQH